MKEVTHQGIVEKITGDRLWVKVERQSACASCAANQYCAASDPRKECIEVTDISRHWLVGEKVYVHISSSLAGRAVFLAYLLPLLAMLLALVVTLLAGGGELCAALFSLLVVGIYYGILYFFKGSLRRKIHFSITLKELE